MILIPRYGSCRFASVLPCIPLELSVCRRINWEHKAILILIFTSSTKLLAHAEFNGHLTRCDKWSLHSASACSSCKASGSAVNAQTANLHSHLSCCCIPCSCFGPSLSEQVASVFPQHNTMTVCHHKGCHQKFWGSLQTRWETYWAEKGRAPIRGG